MSDQSDILRKLKARLLAEAEQEERNAQVLRIGLETSPCQHVDLEAEGRTLKAIDGHAAAAKELRAQVAEIDRMREALEKIANHAGDDFNPAQNHRYVDEWTEAAAFTEVQAIALEALGQGSPPTGDAS